jgi:quercetin dioxygenase-like cupin family protein
VNKPFLKLSALKVREMFPGATARFLHADNITIGYWNFEPGVPIPEHVHVHEQVFNIIDGVFDLTVNGDTKRMERGSAAIIPPNVKHGGRSITACTVIDVFYPVREDLR